MKGRNGEVQIKIEGVIDMFERVDYIVGKIDGDYAYLQLLDASGGVVSGMGEKCVARALLPEAIAEGSHLAYEMMQYTLV